MRQLVNHEKERDVVLGSRASGRYFKECKYAKASPQMKVNNEGSHERV